MANDGKLYLIDGMALLFRSFYALGRARMSLADGTPIGAVYGFTKILLKLLKEQNPSHVVVAWDRQEKTFRHEQYKEYKANRSAPPDDLIPQIHLMKSLVDKLGLLAVSCAGYEGDDCIGTLAKQYEGKGDVFIVTADKDFMQLVDDRVKMVSLKTGDDYTILDDRAVVDYFGVNPNQVVDMLALMGDSSDNVPGVRGIGQKGASKLIVEFGSLENIYENLEKVSNVRIRTMLDEGKESAFLSKQLVTINCNVPMEFEDSAMRFDWETFKANERVKTSLTEMQMTSLVKSIYGEPIQQKIKTEAIRTDIFGAPLEAQAVEVARPSSQWGQRDYKVVCTKTELEEVFHKIEESEVFAFDTETTGLDIIEDRPIGFSVSFKVGSGYYVPIHSNHCRGPLRGEYKEADFDENEVWGRLNESLSKRKGLLLGHHLKFDLHHLANVGVHPGPGPIACSMVAAWILDPNFAGYGIDSLTYKHFQLEKIPTQKLIGKASGRDSMTQVPLLEIGEYAVEDVDATLRVWKILQEKLKGTALDALFWNLEMPLLRVLLKMERAGVNCDEKYLDNFSHEVQARLITLEEEIFERAGETFNVASPKQLGNIMFEKLKIHEATGFKGKLAKTTMGFKTDAGVLEQFESHPFVALVQEFRELAKLLNTYIAVLPRLLKKSTGRIHTQFNQIGTATGRLSSSDPNLQNIPVRTPLGKKVRAAFTAASKDMVIIAADYSQVELRVMAHLSGDEGMIEAFKKGADIHRETAAKLLNKTPAEVTPEERSNAKAINFGIIYGMGPQRLAKEQKITLNEAKSFIEKYFINFAKVRFYLDKQIDEAHKSGVVKTDFGRMRPVPGINSKNPGEMRASENMAINSPIQGTAADIMKLGMLRADKALTERNLKTRLLLQVHDELVLEGPKEEADEVSKIIKEAMEGAVEFSIPLLVDVERGPNWLDVE